MQGEQKKVYILLPKAAHTSVEVRETMKEDEKKPIPWEAVDPKPPVIQSGHMENRVVR